MRGDIMGDVQSILRVPPLVVGQRACGSALGDSQNPDEPPVIGA